jgi:hypothetical protein
VKQFDFACSQLVQKPFAFSFHVPVLFLLDCPRDSRVILRSGVKAILNLAPVSAVAVKGWPLKKVAWMSFGAMGDPAMAILAERAVQRVASGPARIKSLASNLQCVPIFLLRYIRFARGAFAKAAMLTSLILGQYRKLRTPKRADGCPIGDALHSKHRVAIAPSTHTSSQVREVCP